MHRVSTAVARAAVWVVALAVATVCAAIVLLVGGKGSRNTLEGFCVTDGRGPPAADSYGPPHLVGFGQWRCDYQGVNGHASSTATYTDWHALVPGAVVFVIVLLTFLVPVALAYTGDQAVRTRASSR